MAAFQPLLGLGTGTHLHPMNSFEAQWTFRSWPRRATQYGVLC